MKWSESAWKAAQKVYEAILEQPFLKEMAEGTLSAERFHRYLAQDEIYLGNYAREMYALAEIIPDPQQKALFAGFARESLESEKMMHTMLIERFGFDTSAEASVVTKTYNARTLAYLATGSRELGLASMLPCSWVYNEVGLDVLRIARMEGNPYGEWMAEYSNEEYTKGVKMLIDLADEWAAAASEEVRAAMTKAFVEATVFEYAFWDYAYNGESKNYDYINRDWK